MAKLDVSVLRVYYPAPIRYNVMRIQKKFQASRSTELREQLGVELLGGQTSAADDFTFKRKF